MALADDAFQYQLALRKNGRQLELGAFYTPEWMADLLLDYALEPLLESNPGPLHICDPACGAGVFLLLAAKRLRKRGREGDILTGIDIDPGALALVEKAFDQEDLPQPSLLLQNALVHPPGDVDVMVGNPPFQNSIERKSPSPTLRRFALLGGTADLAFEFLAMAHQSIRQGGRIGFVLPRAVLNASSAERLRRELNPRLILTPAQANYFSGASVFVALVVTGPAGPCLTESGEVEAGDSNWWRLAVGGEEQKFGKPLSDCFEVSASMTTADAYSILPLITEGGKGLKLITTGLIDPDENFWGVRPCRFLGRTFSYPMLIPDLLSGSLAERARRARRPKILIAGLSKRIEAILDPSGETLGSVSTYSVFHPEDDLEALRSLLNFLHTEGASMAFRSELGANALGGGSITLTKAFLKNLRI